VEFVLLGYRSRGFCAFNALDRWLAPIGFAFDETSLRLSRHFFHI